MVCFRFQLSQKIFEDEFTVVWSSQKCPAKRLIDSLEHSYHLGPFSFCVQYILLLLGVTFNVESNDKSDHYKIVGAENTFHNFGKWPWLDHVLSFYFKMKRGKVTFNVKSWNMFLADLNRLYFSTFNVKKEHCIDNQRDIMMK